jgi:hypothetical protein
LYPLAFAAALAGCGAPGQVDVPNQTDDTTSAAVSTAPLTYQSGARAICAILDALPATTIGAVNINKPNCNYWDYDNLYYLGSISRSFRLGGGTTLSPQTPVAMSDALLCALKDSDGASVDATKSPNGLGRFGMASRIVVSKFDPTQRQVLGQRLGTLYAFGVPLDLEDQDFGVSFPTEYVSSGVLLNSTTGYYMDLQSSKTTWSLGGSGFIPPAFNLKLDFGQTGNFHGVGTNGVAFTSADKNHAPDATNVGVDGWDPWVQSCNSCKAAGGWFCSCPTPADQQQHDKFVNWTGAQFSNLSDAVLPYYGATGGVTGNYVYKDPSKSWLQLGMPSGNLIPGDPTHDAKNSPSTYLDFEFGLDYDIVKLMLDLNVKFRSGMELVQNNWISGDTHIIHNASVGTSVDAESHADLGAHLTIKNPFFFGPEYLVDETFTIFDSSGDTALNRHADAADITYDYDAGYPFRGYSSFLGGDRSANAEAARQACLAVPPKNNPPVQPGDPNQFLNQVKNAAQSKLYPCNIKLCTQDSANAPSQYYGTLKTCTWNAQTQKVDCVSTGQSCALCDPAATHVDLCDAGGTVYHPSTVTGLPQCQIK